MKGHFLVLLTALAIIFPLQDKAECSESNEKGRVLEEVINISIPPTVTAGQVIFAPSAPVAAPAPAPITRIFEAEKPSQPPKKPPVNPKQPKDSDDSSEDSDPSSSQPPPSSSGKKKTTSVDDESLGAPTRLFRPRFREGNSAENTFTFNSLMIASLAAFIAAILL